MSVKVIRFAPGLRPVFKHEQHDQATHGSWANGTSESSLISTDTQIAFNEGAIKATDNILSPSAYKSQLEGNLNRTYPKTYLEEAVNNPAYQDALQTHLKSIGFPETVKVFSSSAQKGEYFHGSVAPLWDSGAVGYESDESPKEFSVNRSDIIGLGKVADSGVWFRNSKTVKKHQEHDQKTHGNWATGGEIENWNPNDPIPASPRNAGGMTQKIWDNWEHGVDGNQFVELYRQYAGEALGIAVPKSSMDVGGNLNYLTQRGFGGSSTDTVRKQTETILQAIANGKPEQPALYRGMTATDADGQALLNSITKLKAGDTLDMPLVSTTRSLGVATWYAADRSTSGTGNVIMKIQPGAKGVSLSKETSRYPQDHEVITSGKFEVVSVNTIQSSYWQRGVLEPRKVNYTDGSESHYEVATYSPRRYSPEESKTIYETVTSGKYKSLETPTFKVTNDRHNNYPDRPKLSTWEKQPAREFTVVEVKFIEPHVIQKADSKDYGLTFDALFNNAPFFREEDVTKHQEHDQSSHGNWAEGSSGSSLDAMPYEWKPEFKEKERLTARELSSAELNLGREQLQQVAKAPIAIRVSSGDLELRKIVEDGGFKSLTEQPAPTIGFEIEYNEARYDLEKGLWGQPTNANSPIYGYLDTPLQPSIENETVHYGDVKIVLKDNVAGRTTMTPGDSANHGLTPVLVTDARKGNLSLEQVDSAYRSRYFQRGVTSVSRPINSVRTIKDIDYFEAQIHGGVTLGDIKSVTLRKYSIVGESTIAILKEKGIEVIRNDK